MYPSYSLTVSNSLIDWLLGFRSLLTVRPNYHFVIVPLIVAFIVKQLLIEPMKVKEVIVITVLLSVITHLLGLLFGFY